MAIEDFKLAPGFYRNQDGGGYREMHPLCAEMHSAAMTEMSVHTAHAMSTEQRKKLEAANSGQPALIPSGI